jgi:hypothetical protein
MEQKVYSFAKYKKQSKSAVIVLALEHFFKQEEEQDSWQLGKDYFGRYGSKASSASFSGDSEPAYLIAAEPEAVYCADGSGGQGNLSVDYKKLIRGKISAKLRSR